MGTTSPTMTWARDSVAPAIRLDNRGRSPTAQPTSAPDRMHVAAALADAAPGEATLRGVVGAAAGPGNSVAMCPRGGPSGAGAHVSVEMTPDASRMHVSHTGPAELGSSPHAMCRD